MRRVGFVIMMAAEVREVARLFPGLPVLEAVRRYLEIR